MMQHQSQHDEGESSSDGEVASNSVASADICSEDGQASSKDTYPTSKASSARTSSTSTTTDQFSFRKPEYSRQPRQTYHLNNHSSRYDSRDYNNRSGWQAGSGGSYPPSYQPWAGSKLEEEEAASAYTQEEEEFSVEEAQVYRPQSAPSQEIDPMVTLERICNWVGSILRKPDLARKLAGARLELGKDEQGNHRATFWLVDERIDPTSFSIGDKALIRMAFSTEVAPHYKLQLANSKVIVPIE